MKHKHKFQLSYVYEDRKYNTENLERLSYKRMGDIAVFICECGKKKEVKVK